MASDSPNTALDAEAHARALALALDAIEAELDALSPDVSADHIAQKLAGPVRAFDAAAKAAVGGNA